MSAPCHDEEALLSCTACPRLAAFLALCRAEEGSLWHARPVAPYGDPAPSLLVVGLAPGYRGANRTGRPFCGDRSGAWIYRALHELGLAATADPLEAGGELAGVRITNAVKCCPPLNKPTAQEIRTCRDRWLLRELETCPATTWIALGRVAHETLIDAVGARRARHPFALGASHRLLHGGRPVRLLDSFHPSPLNTNTGRMSWETFLGILRRGRDGDG